jgi:HPt (histidine-containing phosphotransfer) domain-containing protein
MPDDPEDVRARLEALRKAFVSQLPDRIRELKKAWKKIEEEWNAESFQEFHRGIHALAGSGAMFGCEALSQRARLLDNLLKPLSAGNEPLSPRTKGLIQDGLAAMKEAATAS